MCCYCRSWNVIFFFFFFCLLREVVLVHSILSVVNIEKFVEESLAISLEAHATAFERGVVEGRTIDEAYAEGVSITHGRNPRKHIWTYAAGSSEQNRQECSHLKCPCIDGFEPQSYVGNNYYCESAFQGTCYVIDRFFPDDPLWDGQQCDNNEGTCCTGTNTPPWFSVDLPDSTSDDIEVRICHDQDTTDEDTPIQLLELYVQ